MDTRHHNRKYGMPEALRPTLEAFLRRAGKPEQLLLTRLWQHWDLVMGAELSGLAWPLGERNRILLVGGEDAMAMQELSLLSHEILERANAFMEKDYFTGVKVSLSLGKAALDRVSHAAHSPPGRVRLEEGARLQGQYLRDMPADSAVARCYAAFVARQKGGS